MFLVPLYDAPRPLGFRPVLVIGLIVVNVWIHLALLVLAGGSEEADFFGGVFQAWGFRPAAPTASTALSSMFLHSDLFHLLGNMLFLWVFGDNVEHGLGRLAFGLTYVLGGLMGTLLHFAMRLGSDVPTIGASGAISAVLGAYLVLYPGNRVVVGYLFWIILWIRYGSVALPAIVVLGFYFLYDNLVPALLGANDGVAFGAHIGGFLFGMAAAGLGRATAFVRP